MSITTMFTPTVPFPTAARRSPIQTLMRDVRHFNAMRAVRHQRIMTIDCALRLINRRHRTFNSLGFDQAFLESEAVDLMEPFLYGGAAPEPEALASVWASHFHFGNRAKQDLVKRVLPMMNDFVYLLENSILENNILENSVIVDSERLENASASI